VHFY
jgi:hypothetical protein